MKKNYIAVRVVPQVEKTRFEISFSSRIVFGKNFHLIKIRKYIQNSLRIFYVIRGTIVYAHHIRYAVPFKNK